MLRQGPIPRFVHGLLEYLVAAVFIAAPFVLTFDDDAAITASLAAGVLLLVVAATTNGPTSLIDSMSLSLHVLFDYVLAAVLIAAPFLFGFSDESTPTALFIVVGVLHLLVTIATRFRPADEQRPGRTDVPHR